MTGYHHLRGDINPWQTSFCGGSTKLSSIHQLQPCRYRPVSQQLLTNHKILTIRGGEDVLMEDEAVKLLIEKFEKEIIALFKQDNHAVKVLLLLNLTIFYAWHYLPHEFMKKHFLDDSTNRKHGRWWCGLGASLSHSDLNHIAGNIGVYAILGPRTANYLGNTWFAMFVLFSGHFSSYFGSVWMNAIEPRVYDTVNFLSGECLLIQKSPRASLGFSGIVAAMSVIFAFASDANDVIVFREKSLTPTNLLGTLIANDILGFFSSFIKPTNIEHVIHIGGYIAGFIFQYVFANRFHIFAKIKSLFWLQ